MTYFQGTKLTDTVWFTKVTKGMNACALPFGFHVGDHCAHVVDIQAASWEGKTQPMVQSKAHLLNTEIPGLLEGYAEVL